MAIRHSSLPRFDLEQLKLRHPFAMILDGGRRTGKTQLIKNIILNRNRIIKPDIDHVIWFYAGAQEEVFREITKSMGEHRVEFVKGLPTSESIDDGYLASRNGSKLVIIDDLMTDANKREDVNNLFTRGRHENTSVALLVQNFHNSGKHMRENSLNTDYIARFKSPRNQSGIVYLASQMGKREFIRDAYEKATRSPFSYLFFDFRSDTPDELHFRSDILAPYPRVFVEKNYK